jgi:hypothetical protein
VLQLLTAQPCRFFKLASEIDEKIEKQPGMLSGGELKEFQVSRPFSSHLFVIPAVLL